MRLMSNDLEVSHALVAWYGTSQRELPWRRTKDPYLIWVSEIILQQTRVAQGHDYYNRFVERFPTVATLAEAEEDEVLKYWQGLGYYSRARNMRMAALDVMNRFGGSFPQSHDEVLSLKGIGEYTAAAIVSFAWNLPFAVVDGNVFRVLSRLFAVDTPIDTTVGKRQFTQLAGLLLDPMRPGLHNQAIMEFGALHCVPRNPDCTACPLAYRCQAYAANRVALYPAKQGKTKTRPRFFNYLYIIQGGTTWLNRREEKDIWNGLYEFPLIETDRSVSFAELQQTDAFRHLFHTAGSLTVTDSLEGVKHILSHQIIHASFYRIELEQPGEGLHAYLPVPQSEVERYAVPRLLHSYLERLGVE